MGETHSGRKWWLFLALILVLVAGGAAYLLKGHYAAAHEKEESKAPDFKTDVRVEVVKPTKGLLERKTAQAGTVMAFEWADLYAEVPGYLTKQTVDIGSVVKKGDLLVEIDVPELRARVEQQTAALDLARAQVDQKKAAVDNARAELKAVQAKIGAANAKLKSDRAYYKFRQRQADRYRELLAQRSIDARLVDEQEDRLEASKEAVNASVEAVHAAEAAEEAMTAKIEQAKADLKEAEQKVKVTKAQLDHAMTMVKFATIKAPFDGVITKRTYNVGDLIQTATGGNRPSPMLTIQHTEKMRMVVPIPDRDVPYCNAGDPAVVVFDALPNEVFNLKVSRVAASEDLQTKTMRCEVDIPNTEKDPSQGKIRQGMYGLVTITLSQVKDALSIPSSCLVGKAQGRKAWVYVVRDGKAQRVPIEIGLDNGIDVEVLKGLRPDDEVVTSYSGNIGDDVAVSVGQAAKSTTSASSH